MQVYTEKNSIVPFPGSNRNGADTGMPDAKGAEIVWETGER